MSSDRTFTTNISTRGILGSSEICFWRELCPWPCWVSSQCCPRSPSELRRRKSSLHSPTPLDAFGLGLGLGSARCSDLHSPDPSTPPASAQDPLVSCGRGNPLSIPPHPLTPSASQLGARTSTPSVSWHLPHGTLSPSVVYASLYKLHTL